MIERVDSYLSEVRGFSTTDPEELEAFRIRFLGRKGVLNDLFEEFKGLPGEQKRQLGQILNQLKTEASARFAELKEQVGSPRLEKDATIDLSRPVRFSYLGTRHPLSLVRNEIVGIFNKIGFTLSYGPEIEDDFHNFTALNFPPDHPARDMQDTFIISRDPELLLRTHTSSVQVRVMRAGEPPIRTISPGRVFRNETITARAHCIFHQVEGLYIDKEVSLADLKQTLLYFAKEMFGAETQIRLRPSYFPFTEPSAEMDISCLICGGEGCRICKHSGWVEILGCGMVDPDVLKNCGIDPEVYSGFAFGMGIERIALLKYQINDLRLFFENDLRFLKQFSAVH
jgi:phenylalanyl-tRNA synthetase alpha chain